MKIKGKSLSLFKKQIFITVLILTVYALGKNIPLPFINVKEFEKATNSFKSLALAANITGTDLSRFSLFSLGLGPWMSAMIIWQLLVLIKKLNFDKLSKKERDVYQLVIALIIAICESVGMVAISGSGVKSKYELFVFVVVSTAGSFILIWLSNVNIMNGIGGTFPLIFFGMISGMKTQVRPLLFLQYDFKKWAIWIAIIAIGLLLAIIYYSVAFERAEYRIEINRVLLSSKFGRKTYIPIKLNPGGGMAVMFDMSILMIPNYILQILHKVKPKNHLISWGANNFNLTSVWGVTFYVLILIFLAILFGFLNVDSEKIAKDLRDSGDYIEGCQPGIDTQEFLQKKIVFFSTIGAIFTVFVAGLPVYLGVVYPKYSSTVLIPGTVMISVSMFTMIIEQVRAINILHEYPKLFDIED